MAATQNLTIRLPAKTVKKARIVAAQRGTSISALVAEKIEEVAGEDDAYEAARRHAVRLLDKGFHLGGRVPKRDSLHER
jgi:hypothetical protein